ncbi:acyl-CoA dehydrogenase family protein [Alteromonas lipolytica]|uniref:3-methylmercaptopropionyl-CoA dehydrogenase n=1 Tax=Alteromonas lipolytica TaxID=1856405 RepID=A0A1E8FCP3_9ALTE|nr:acyl-CoA dehydrogenase family protein [Alteromonas lipolytica]OFI33707.1 acyl-CoA dehydrogenase [Alteromonas lipolytica]GGF69171.1 acyl-CoA dehydrogenase [Alteromonas lipolytica]
MPAYTPPLADFTFLVKDWLKIDELYQSLGLDEFDADLALEVIEQGGRFATDVVAPLNREGDEQGCKLNNGQVVTPDGFAAAYQSYVENGWNAMLGDIEYGGQGLPYSMAVPVHEMLNSASLSWRLTSMLTESAVLAVTKHASDELKAIYLEKLVSGEWTGTMNLTEPQAGSDLSLLATKAEPNDDGSYCITGSKIFITAGDHDWTDNIIHMVLARLPDAPPGVKGISLFLVPKFLVNEAGEPGERNAAVPSALEKKMGIKASPTCVMNFDGAKGWLVGEPHCGLACMFTMMNDARFQVGLEGLGAAEASFQGALTYARERLQSRAPQGVQQPEAKADAIVYQPDIARMLLTQKALTEGNRALAMLYAKYMDIAHNSSGDAHDNAEGVLQFLTPICKAFMTDAGLETTSLGIQVFGGHGYIREWGMEQLMRDVRIAMLYEGTNGIQSLDLIGRKLTRDRGDLLGLTRTAFAELTDKMTDLKTKAEAAELLEQWYQTSLEVKGYSAVEAAGGACDYLAYSGYCLLGVLWYSMADAAATADNPVVAAGKQKTRDFYVQRILPRAQAHKSALQQSAETLLAPQGGEYDYL